MVKFHPKNYAGEKPWQMEVGWQNQAHLVELNSQIFPVKAKVPFNSFGGLLAFFFFLMHLQTSQSVGKERLRTLYWIMQMLEELLCSVLLRTTQLLRFSVSPATNWGHPAIKEWQNFLLLIFISVDLETLRSLKQTKVKNIWKTNRSVTRHRKSNMEKGAAGRHRRKGMTRVDVHNPFSCRCWEDVLYYSLILWWAERLEHFFPLN